MSARRPELVGLYWTVSGPVVVHFGREWSYFSWADRCAEARKVGFAGLGIWHADLEHVLETETLADMKRAMDDNGLTRLELEFLMDWFLDPDDERRKASDKTRRSHSSPNGSASSAISPPSAPTRRSSTS